MRIAALYDIHANLPALEAVLAELRQVGADQVVVGGDVVPGPMPQETLRRLLDLQVPVHFIHGNSELALLAQMAAPDADSATYWGTTGGGPLSVELRAGYRWAAQQLQPEFETLLASWPRTLTLEVAGLGRVLFCHATPRSEVEIFTRLTAEERLLPLFEGLGVDAVVCGHTHLPFDRRVGATRVVNPGSVGEPYGAPGAYWALLGPDVALRHTPYDLEQAAERIRATAYPLAPETAEGILHPQAEGEVLELFSRYELTEGS